MYSVYTRLKASYSSSKRVRNARAETTSRSDSPALSRTIARLSITRRVSVSMSPRTYSPVSGSAATWPVTNRKSPARAAWQYGAWWNVPGAMRRSIMRGPSPAAPGFLPALRGGARRRGGGEVERLGDQLVRPPPGLVVVGDRHDDRLLGAVLRGDVDDAGADLLGRADDRAPARRARRAVERVEEPQRLVGRRDGDKTPLAQERERHLAPPPQPPRLLLGVGAQRPHGDRGARRVEPARAREALAVERGDLGALGVDEVGERVRQPALAGPDRALVRRAEQPGLGRLRPAGERADVARERVPVREAVVVVREELGELLGEVVGRGLPAVALEGERRHRVGARRAPDAEVDAAGVQPGEDAEGLRDLQRRVVREHHAAAADAYALGRRGDRPDEDLGARAGERRPAVVLGDPVAVVAEGVGQPREVDRVAQRPGSGRSLRDGGLVEDGEAHEFGHAIDASKRGCRGPGCAGLQRFSNAPVQVVLARGHTLTKASHLGRSPVFSAYAPPTHTEVLMSHRHRRRHRHGVKAVQTAATAAPAAASSSAADAAASSSDAAGAAAGAASSDAADAAAAASSASND